MTFYGLNYRHPIGYLNGYPVGTHMHTLRVCIEPISLLVTEVIAPSGQAYVGVGGAGSHIFSSVPLSEFNAGPLMGTLGTHVGDKLPLSK